MTRRFDKPVGKLFRFVGISIYSIPSRFLVQVISCVAQQRINPVGSEGAFGIEDLGQIAKVFAQVQQVRKRKAGRLVLPEHIDEA
ncbi:MAG TPA: hypothetical protein DIV44_03745 [Leeuwenhoekiella sp.]|nr:hypothetical protein [Leeuwenhoekiella sp.]